MHPGSPFRKRTQKKYTEMWNQERKGGAQASGDGKHLGTLTWEVDKFKL